MPSITYTASRTVTGSGIEVMSRVITEIGHTYGNPLKFVSGAAEGGDTFLALGSLFTYPQAEHLVCIPEYRHNYMLIRVLRMWQQTHPDLRLEIVETGLEPLKRNGYMLDRGDELRAFPQTSKEQLRGSGTWACIRWARKRLMPIYVYPLSGEDPWVENV